MKTIEDWKQEKELKQLESELNEKFNWQRLSGAQGVLGTGTHKALSSILSKFGWIVSAVMKHTGGDEARAREILLTSMEVAIQRHNGQNVGTTLGANKFGKMAAPPPQQQQQ